MSDMRVTMAQGTRAFRLPEEPHSQYIEDEKGELWIVQQSRRVNGEYEVLCRHATRIEQKLYEKEQERTG